MGAIIIIGATIPQIIFAFYFTYMLNPRFNKILTMLIFTVLMYPLYIIAGNYANMLLKNFLFYLTFTIFIVFMYKDRLFKKALVFFMWIIGVGVIESVVIIFATWFLGFDINNLDTFSIDKIVIICICCFLEFIGCMAALKFWSKKTENKLTNHFFYIIAYGFAQIMLLYLMNILMIEYKVASAALYSLIIIVIVLSFAFGVLFYRSSRRQIRESEKVKWLESEIYQQRQHYSELQNQYNEYRKLRHDFYDHISVLERLSEMDNRDKMANYFKQVEDYFTKLSQVSFCSNAALDSLIYSKNEVAKTLGIQTSYNLALPENLCITDFDLCSLVSNLLQNAITGAAEFNDKEKYIMVDCYDKFDKLIITVKNSSNPPDKGLKTTKADKDRHGLGIDIVRSIVHKYGGEAVFEYQKGEFVSIISINAN